MGASHRQKCRCASSMKGFPRGRQPINGNGGVDWAVYLSARCAVPEMAISKQQGWMRTTAPCCCATSIASYLRKGLSHLPLEAMRLDASRPWLCYWIIRSLALLGALPTDCFRRCIDTLKRCQHPTGGFGGGPQQNPHTAPTYAAVLALYVRHRRVCSYRPSALYKFFLRQG